MNRIFASLILCCATSVVAPLATSAAQASVVSTFGANQDGWQSVTLAYPHPGVPPVIIGSFTPTWNATGGNPGGFISLVDPDGGGPTGNTQYWQAPAKFLGDQSSAYGQNLSYDLIDMYPFGNSEYIEEDLLLVSGAPPLTFHTFIPSTTDWTHYSVGLSESGWTIDTNSGPGSAASEAVMRAALSSLSGLYIRAEYQLGVDTQKLDNVVLTVVPEPSTMVLACLAAAALAVPSLRRRRHGRGMSSETTVDPA